VPFLTNTPSKTWIFAIFPALSAPSGLIFAAGSMRAIPMILSILSTLYFSTLTSFSALPPQELSANTIKRFNLDIQELSESPLDISSSNSFPNSNAGNGRSSSFLTGPSV
jgi:hypothetical protein